MTLAKRHPPRVIDAVQNIRAPPQAKFCPNICKQKSRPNIWLAKSVGKTHPLSTADKFFRSIIDGSNVDGCKQIMLRIIRSIFAGAQFIRGITDGDDADAYKLIQLRIIRSTFTGAQFIRGRFVWNASGAYLRKTLSSQHLPPQRPFASNDQKVLLIRILRIRCLRSF